MSLHVFGIRHHGPGSARALRAALEQLAPDLVLVEGPPDANDALSCLTLEGMVPPVALLVHALEAPQLSACYPFAEFSPEWQALRYSATRGIPARFMDLPCAHALALRRQAAARSAEEREPDEQRTREPNTDEQTDDDESGDGESDDALRDDPLGLLAEAAGFADREQWWEVQVEQRRDAAGLFDGILEAMTALREQHAERSLFERQREAYMRSVIRAAQREGFVRIALVCGAWHAPALAALGPAKADGELLKGLPKLKVAATWIPWTYSRLSARSGYGAGVDSPGWYEHIWRHADAAPTIWATLAARLLRGQDLDASSANVIETVRLAHALAAMRELPAPGLSELREAIEAVLCGGERAPLLLIRDQLEIADALGRVPEQAGKVPLVRDFEREAKRLRLKLSTEQVQLELDLRGDTDRDRSRLLHRLDVLEVAWGRRLHAGRGAGTFKEAWQIAWRPELAVDLISANLHGNTVDEAAARALAARAQRADLAELSRLVERSILAQLPAALDALLVELDARAATASDTRVQMEALGPLARLVRYSDVRATRAEHLLPVLHGLFERVVVGLLPACTQLDDAAAAQLLEALGHAHAACLLLDDPARKADWLSALHALVAREAVHPLIRGRVCRLLLEQHVLTEGELAQRASLALSPGVEPGQAAQWIAGLVAGDGLLLVHQDELLATLDSWLSQLSDALFQAQLPLLRRAFSSLAAAERRAVAQRIKRAATGSRAGPSSSESAAFDPDEIARVLPVLAQILGVPHV
ncbi:MAG: hypothetical protein JWN48_5761 [Myxococcaceae bacterium]|nr:hypothetical protein [Myxococcaceae bacterium]